ncbi:MAG: type I-U CRISPR-associated protein Cas7 [Opitutaceae bacterium]|nr:type I-U CRISPR-associated protein Cas7 [Opitutaceae bacterium]
MPTQPLDTAALLNGTQNRLVIQATLKPVAGKTRFQPAGFPEIGHVIYDAPDGKKVCIVDSAASMANHLETVCVNGFDQTLVDELNGLPYVQCVTGGDKNELVVTTLSEAHRLASDYFLDGKRIDTDGNLSAKKFVEELRDAPDKFGLRNLEKKTHPLPAQWWNIFRTIFRYDPNSLVHGILFPALGIKLPRVLTATLDAFDAVRVGTSGVKFDKLEKTKSKQSIFSKDEETASEIRATFVIDLSLIRSFGRDEDKGLNAAKKQLLLGLALWKIGKLLGFSFRFRSECDLELDGIKIDGADTEISALNIGISDLITAAAFSNSPITKIYREESDLFRPDKNKDASSQDDDDNEGGNDEE